jgi:hypothetical protein
VFKWAMAEAYPQLGEKDPHWTRNRRELAEWLTSVSPSVAELYQGAVELLFALPVPGFTRFVSHAVREIRNRLPQEVSGLKSAGRLDYTSRMDELSTLWKREAGVDGKSPQAGDEQVGSAAPGIVVSKRMAKKIAALVDDHERARARPRDAAMRLFEGVAPRNQKYRDSVRPVVLQWMEVCNWFMERTHESGSRDADFDLGELRRNFELFESTLLAMSRAVSAFYENVEELDAILGQEPTEDSVAAAVARMGYGEYHRYFFDRLQNPAWIQPLKVKKFFSAPPPPVANDEKGTIGFGGWPESRYLFRMAKLAPEIVTEVVVELPDTENIRIHDDVVDIALVLPGPLAARLVPQAKKYIRAPYRMLLPEKLGALVGKLVDNGEVDASLDLARTLLEVLPDPKPVLVAEPTSHIDSWHYERILRRDMAVLVRIAGMRGFELLTDLLADALRLSQKDKGDEGFEDYSFVWRPDLAHGRGFSRGVSDPLTSAVLDACSSILTNGQSTVAEIVGALEGRKWLLFRRISLHVLKLFGESAPESVVERLRNPGRYDGMGMSREFWLLAARHFPGIPADAKVEMLKWVDAGPDLAVVKERWEQFTGVVVSEDELAKYGKQWRRDRLNVLREGLTDDAQVRLEKFVAELGPAADLTEPTTKMGSFGQVNVQTKIDLPAMEISEIVALLQTWQPSPEPFGEKIAGLASQLASAVANDPLGFGSAALQFKELDPTYVREFIQGLREPAKTRDAFDWRDVLGLCRWVVDQPRTIPGRTGGLFDQDKDWSGARAAVVRLLAAGFESDALAIALRSEAWGILEKLTEDPDPTPEDEAKYFENKNTEPSNLSINTVRGEAMHAVVQYALWVRRSFESVADRDGLVARGFAEMPEVRTVLERRLDSVVEPSLTIRSVYGRWTPWLHFLDAGWFEKNVETIFPIDPGLRRIWDSAWGTYVVLCEPYNEVIRVLEPQYRLAIERIGEYAFGESHLGNPDNSLASHLLTQYWRGRMASPREAGLLKEFYAQASDKLRGGATGSVGKALLNDPGEVAAVVIDRMKDLWALRIEVARTSKQGAGFEDELKAFSWWFASKKFEDTWSVEQLLQTLRIVKGVDADMLVMERLAELCPRFPNQVIDCLMLMVEGDDEGLGILGWKGEARIALAGALASADREAAKKARELVHKLGGLGYFEFRDLLRELPKQVTGGPGEGAQVSA